MSDIHITGGGIVGLLLARELAEAGVGVILLERGRCCREASWAGGGIVSPLYPWRYAAPITALAGWAQDFYPELVVALRETTGIDPELNHCGLLMLQAPDESEALQWASKTGRRIMPVDSEFIYRKEARLAGGFTRGLWMPDVANVRNPRLGQALYEDLIGRLGVTIMEHCEVRRIVCENSRVQSLEVTQAGHKRRIPVSTLVVSAGAWSGEILRSTGVRLQVEPVKGQMLLYKSPHQLIESVVLTEGRYLIPRKDGHILAGSTLEYCGFDKSPTDDALHSLRESAERLVPDLKSLQIKAQWAGLRPGAPGGIPYIGALPGFENLYVNAGQFRNGLVLAPASARLLADLLLGRSPIVDPVPFLPGTTRETGF
ncbi:MAG: glycine oxidase ThiO [Pseudohongiellaceae bacterium]